MKVIVAGSRTITNRSIVNEVIKRSPHTPFHGELVVGGASGVDQIAEDSLGFFQHVEVTKFEPDWDEYGKAAGPIRNEEMAEYADALIAVWDGESPGTRDMIEKALDHGLDTYVEVV